MTLHNTKNRRTGPSGTQKIRVRLHESRQEPKSESLGQPNRKRAINTDPVDWERLSSYRPLPLGWKDRPGGRRGLMFKHIVEDSPRLFYLTAAETADFLGLSPKTLLGWRTLGVGPQFTKIGGRTVRYNVADLLEWAAERRRASTSQE